MRGVLCLAMVRTGLLAAGAGIESGIPTAPGHAPTQATARTLLLVLGDSLSAGYGINLKDAGSSSSRNA